MAWSKRRFQDISANLFPLYTIFFLFFLFFFVFFFQKEKLLFAVEQRFHKERDAHEKIKQMGKKEVYSYPDETNAKNSDMCVMRERERGVKRW